MAPSGTALRITRVRTLPHLVTVQHQEEDENVTFMF